MCVDKELWHMVKVLVAPQWYTTQGDNLKMKKELNERGNVFGKRKGK